VCPTFETEPCELLDWQATQRGLLGFAETPLGGKSGTRCRLPGEQAFVRMEQLLQREEKQRSHRDGGGEKRRSPRQPKLADSGRSLTSPLNAGGESGGGGEKGLPWHVPPWRLRSGNILADPSFAPPPPLSPFRQPVPMSCANRRRLALMVRALPTPTQIAPI
jgi:hypothetical protein